MKIAVVTFAGMGARKDLKTEDILPVITTLKERNVLSQIVCSSGMDSNFTNVHAVVPRLVSGSMRRMRIPRAFAEAAFDILAARALTQADIVLVHPAHYPRVMKKAKKQGSIVVGIASEAHPLFNKALAEEEAKLLCVKARIQHPWTQEIAQAVASTEYIIVPSEFVRNTYVEYGYNPDRIITAPLDISLERFTPANKTPPSFTLLFMAHTQILKGLGYLLTAWEEVNLTDARLVLVGSMNGLQQELQKKYRDQIQKHSNITLIEGTAHPETFYTNASAFVFPSLTEGYSRAVAEAMSSGLPVLTTEHAVALVQEGYSGFIVPIRSSSALAKKIRFAYEHPEKLVVMGKNARKSIEEKKPFGEAVYEICEEIMRREAKTLHS